MFTAMVRSDIAQFTAAQLESLDPAERLLRLDELPRRLIEPYLVLAGILVLLAAYIKLSPLPDPELADEWMASSQERSVFRHPSLVLGAVTVFFYVGAEVVPGGDHLGPVCWTEETADAAMAKACELVQCYVEAGFAKIHLDTRMASSYPARAIGVADRRGYVLPGYRADLLELQEDMTLFRAWIGGVPAKLR